MTLVEFLDRLVDELPELCRDEYGDGAVETVNDVELVPDVLDGCGAAEISVHVAVSHCP